MSRFLILFFTIVLLGQFGFAQTDPQNITWSDFSPEGEHFSVKVPAKSDSQIPRTLNAEVEENGAHKFYYGNLDGTYFFIFSERSDKSFDVQRSLNFLRSNVPNSQPQRIGIVKVDLYRFKDNDGFFHSAVFFILSGREYIFHCVTRKENDPLAKGFLESLRISATGNITGTPNSVFPTLGPGGGLAIDRAFPLNGTATRNDVVPKTPSSSTPFLILSKPRPPYTELASQYRITGSVKVRVSLLANGTIGTITPITFLPFGLTERAVEAAKLIRFEPKKVNGQAVDSGALFEYNFNIY